MENFIVVVAELYLRIIVISLSCAIVLAPLLLSVSFIQKKVSAHSFYVLYLLLSVRLLIPVTTVLPKQLLLLPEPFQVLNDNKARLTADHLAEGSLDGGYADTGTMTEDAGQDRENIKAVNASAGEGAQIQSLFSYAALFWAAGAAVCIFWTLGSCLAAGRVISEGCVPAGETDAAMLKRLCGELGIKRTVNVYRSRKIVSPMAFGLFRPAVILPEQIKTHGQISTACVSGVSDKDLENEDLENENPENKDLENIDLENKDLENEDLEMILRHELMHIRRRDIAYKVVLSLACAVHWFNPLVWIMSRQAGYNLELCCDDEAVRGMSEQERRRYGSALLNAAQSIGQETLSAGFASGKKQLGRRRANLFAKKKNSCAFVCIILAAAMLMSGLIGYDNVQGDGRKAFVDRKGRKLYEDYFYKHYNEENASVILADLSGDGKAEMAVLTINVMEDSSAEWNTCSMRKKIRTEDFANALIEFYYVKDGKVVQFPGTAGVANAHAGWGYCDLVPYGRHGYALLDFSVYTDASGAYFSYGLSQLDLSGNTGDFITVDQGSAYAQAETEFIGQAAAAENNEKTDPAQLLERIEGYRQSGVPCVVFQDAYVFMEGRTEFEYLNVPPSDAFSGKIGMDIPSLSKCVVANGGKVDFMLPDAKDR